MKIIKRSGQEVKFDINKNFRYNKEKIKENKYTYEYLFSRLNFLLR